MNGLLVAADERAAEVDTFEVVFFGLQIGDLTDVVTEKDVRVSIIEVPIFMWLHISWLWEALPYRVQQTP